MSNDSQYELEIKDLHVTVEGHEILKGLNLKVRKGEIVALMGPNGSGKSTLAFTLMGNPDYTVTKGEIIYKGEDITKLEPDERARKGIFLSFQYPSAISGVTVSNFLRTALNSVRDEKIPVQEFIKLLKEKMELLEVKDLFSKRYLNEGFSGGEKKRNEILQMAVLNPKLAVLDETDSGLDIDALRIVAKGVNTVKTPEMTVLLITHYQRLLHYIKPDTVHVLLDGRIVTSGTHELAEKLEREGYDWLMPKALERVSLK